MKKILNKLYNNLTLEKCEEHAKRTNYAIEANEDTEPINYADAGAFFLEGYKQALKDVNEVNKIHFEIENKCHLTKCPYTEFMIGSSECEDCKSNLEYNLPEQWVKCERF